MTTYPVRYAGPWRACVDYASTIKPTGDGDRLRCPICDTPFTWDARIRMWVPEQDADEVYS